MMNPHVGAAILAVLMGLSACGQRGPLFLPKPPDAPKTTSEGAPQGESRG